MSSYEKCTLEKSSILYVKLGLQMIHSTPPPPPPPPPSPTHTHTHTNEIQCH